MKNQQVLLDHKMTLSPPAGKSKAESPDNDKKKQQIVSSLISVTCYVSRS